MRRLSVVIACYNAAGTLGIQLDALAAQRCDVDWDVLVCDNGSTDDSVAVAESRRGRLPGLAILPAVERRGPGYARNVGVAHTTAPLLAFCDADDEVDARWLATISAGLEAHEFVAGSFDTSKLNRRAVLRSRPQVQTTGLQASTIGPRLPHAGAGNLGIRRETFVRVGGFDPSVGCLEDTELCWRAQLAGVPLTFLPDARVHVRLRSSLPGMWRQGRAYGTASALLEHRYRGCAEPDVAVAAPTSSRLARVGSALTGALRPGGLAGVTWQLGWHVGQRSWRPEQDTGPARQDLGARSMRSV